MVFRVRDRPDGAARLDFLAWLEWLSRRIDDTIPVSLERGKNPGLAFVSPAKRIEKEGQKSNGGDSGTISRRR